MLDVAIKEWSVVCDLLLDGKLAILLRKGGIHEDAGPGHFEPAYRRFAFFPSWEHQVAQRIKQAYRDRVQMFEREPQRLTFRGLGEVDPTVIWQVPHREAFDRLADLHCWTKAQIDMRFGYESDRPLYLMAVRAYRLVKPKTVTNRPQYSGCRSWVPLEAGDEVDDHGARPVMDEAAFGLIIERIKSAFA